jgi:hypothetical protein
MICAGLRAGLSLIALLSVFAPAMARAQPAAPAGDRLVIQGLGRGTVELGGKWQFKTGDDRAWASPGFDDSGWEQIRVDTTYGRQGHFGYSGYSWYRRHIDFVPVAGVQQDLAIIVEPIGAGISWGGPYEVYWNGVLIGREGRMPPGPDWSFRPPPNSFGLGQAGSGVLAIRTWKGPPQFTDTGTTGGMYLPPRAGSAEAVAAELGDLDHIWLRDHQFYFDENLLYALIGVLGLLAWLQSRSQKVLIWAALYSLTQPAHVLLYNAHLGLPFYFTLGFNEVVEQVQSVFLWLLLVCLLDLDRDQRIRRWTRELAAIGIVCAVLDWLANVQDWTTPRGAVFQVADGVLAFPANLVMLYPLVLIGCAIGKRVGLANWLVAIAASLVEMIGVVRIASLQGARFTHWHRLYSFIQSQLFAVNGNYFDAQNIAVTLLLIAIIYAVHRYLAEQSERRGALEQEFRSAQELQRILIPESLPPLPGYAVTSAYIPAQEVGGDFFQLIAQADGAAMLVLGDVSGKGLKAAMTVSLLVGAVRTLTEASTDPAEILAGLNRRLEGRLQNGFVTCLVLRLEPDGGCLIANAGHLSPFLNDEEVALTAALPLGLVPDCAFETTAVQLGVGDRLTLYTDGLLEARNAAGELYGFDRVRELIQTQPDAQRASEAAVSFGQDDDITVLTLTRLAVGVESTILLLAPKLVGATA